jgi:hypothetical protein
VPSNVFGGHIMMLSQHQINQQLKYVNFKTEIAAESPIPCNFMVGDFVTFTNEFGVFFRKPKQIIGFSAECDLPERFIFTESDAYWFPKKAEQLDKVEKTSIGCLLVREVTPQSLYQFENELNGDLNWALLVRDNELHCVWCNDSTLEVVTYCEGDIIWISALNREMYESEIFRTISFFNDN